MFDYFVAFMAKVRRIDDLSSFIYFYENQPLEMQIIIGMAIFGLLTLVYIFVVAIFIDKHI